MLKPIESYGFETTRPGETTVPPFTKVFAD